jgi:AraC-like DNA-binding protein
MHAIWFPYFCCVVEGEIDMRLGIPVRQGKSRGVVNSYDIFTLSSNCVLLIPPGVFFPEKNMHWDQPSVPPVDSRVFWLHILPNGAYCHTSTTRKGVHSSDNFDVFVPDNQLGTITEILTDELQSSHSDIALSAQSALLLLMLRVQNGLSNGVRTAKSQNGGAQEATVSDISSTGVNSTILERACLYIQKNRGVPLDIDDISTHAYVSPSHLAKLFRTELKTTVKKYVLEQRMEAARSMLINTEMSVQEIARFTGYIQSPQFIRVFKQVHHVTPLKFRQRHRHHGY